MSHEQNIDIHVIASEIEKRLNRISGGSAILAIRDLLEDTKRNPANTVEALTTIRERIQKIMQPTAGRAQIIIDIVALIDAVLVSDIEVVEPENVTAEVTAEVISEPVTIVAEETVTEEVSPIASGGSEIIDVDTATLLAELSDNTEVVVEEHATVDAVEHVAPVIVDEVVLHAKTAPVAKTKATPKKLVKKSTKA